MDLWLCPANQIETAKPMRCKKEGRDFLVLKNTQGEFFVTENLCSHARVPLHTGQWDPAKTVLTCAAHGARFDLTHGGKPLCAPATSAIQMVACEVRKNDQDGADWVVADYDDAD